MITLEGHKEDIYVYKCQACVSTWQGTRLNKNG